MPKKLIPSGWVEGLCQYLLPLDAPAASNCGKCGQEFSLWNGRRHCMFCGYIFHRNSCTSKVPVPGQFFRQRICPSCQYYRDSASSLLSQGEEFECLNSDDGIVHISLCEDTAELVLHWKDKALKETVDLSLVEVRKGISHMARNTESSGASYDPLRCLSLFLREPLGEQTTTCQLKAPSALACHSWVESVKCAIYVYGRMLEQACAEEQFIQEDRAREEGKDLTSTLTPQSEGAKSPSTRWYKRRYLPMPSTPSSPKAEFSEEWDNIPYPGTTAEASEACGFNTSAVFPFPPTQHSSLATSHSSGYMSDLSFSLHSNQVLPKWSSSTHNFSSTSRKRHTYSNTRSLPSTPGLHPVTPTASGIRSLPPSSAATPKLHPTTCNCHTSRTLPSRESKASGRPQSASWLSSHLPWTSTTPTLPELDDCCDHCRSYCRLAAELDS